MSLYGIKSSSAALLSHLAGVLREIGYCYKKGDLDVWIRPSVKPDGTEYHKMVLYYVDDIFGNISNTNEKY